MPMQVEGASKQRSLEGSAELQGLLKPLVQELKQLQGVLTKMHALDPRMAQM